MRRKKGKIRMGKDNWRRRERNSERKKIQKQANYKTSEDPHLKERVKYENKQTEALNETWASKLHEKLKQERNQKEREKKYKRHTHTLTKSNKTKPTNS